MLYVFRKSTLRNYPSSLSVWARESSGQSSPSYVEDWTQDSALAEPIPVLSVGFDSELFSHARRNKFTPPAGYSLGQCWTRIDELLLSEKKAYKSLRVGDLLLLANFVLVNKGSHTVSLSKEEIVRLVIPRVEYRDRFPTMFIAIHFLRFACNANILLISSLVNACTATLLHSSSAKLSELVEFCHLFSRLNVVMNVEFVSAAKSRIDGCEPLPEGVRGPTQFTAKQLLSELASRNRQDLIDLGVVLMKKVKGVDCPEFSALVVKPPSLIPGDSLCVEGLLEGTAVVFERMQTDMNDKPAYWCTGGNILYSKNGSWQISSASNLSKRVAYQLGDQWRKWDKQQGFLSAHIAIQTPSLSSSSVQLGVRVQSDPEPQRVKKQWAEEFQTAIMAEQTVHHDVLPQASIATLEARIKLLEKKFEPREKKSMFKNLTNLIDSLGATTEPTGVVNSSFESTRLAYNQRAKTDAIKKLVRKKFN